MRTTSNAGRNVHRNERRRRLTSPGTWIAALAAILLSGAIALAMTPAQASATVDVQLTLSGVASSDNPTGGAQVGVHPGDTVVLHASALPTAGAPAGLGNSLAGLVSGVAGLQVKILSGNLPGVHYPALLGKVPNCGGRASIALRSLAKGSYSFRYVVQKVSLLTGLLGAVTGCRNTTITPTQDQLGALTRDNVKVTDNAVYSGTIVVAKNPPAGKLGVQLPQQSVSVKAGPVHTSVKLPGATVGVPNPVPSITKALGGLAGRLGGGAGGGSANGNSGGGSVNYTPPPLTVPQEVMPHAVNFGGANGERYVAGGPAPAVGGHVVAPREKVTSTAAPVAHPSEVANAQPGKQPVHLGAKDGSGAFGGKALPVVLAIVAILALSVVTAGYARMVLLRRH
jgi:hypothetical protein